MEKPVGFVGTILYCLLPTWGHLGLPALFVGSSCIILSMYVLWV